MAKTSFLFYDFIKVTGIIPALLLCRPKVRYVNKETKKQLKGGILIISNHNSYLDPVTIMASLPKRRVVFVTSEDLYSSKFLKWFLTYGCHCIPVNKTNFNINTFRKVSENLKDGRVVAIFPEGGLGGQDDGVQAFKDGAVMMAMKNNVPILPMYIENRNSGKNILIGELIYPQNLTKNGGGLTNIKKCSEILHSELSNLRIKATERS